MADREPREAGGVREVAASSKWSRPLANSTSSHSHGPSASRAEPASRKGRQQGRGQHGVQDAASSRNSSRPSSAPAPGRAHGPLWWLEQPLPDLLLEVVLEDELRHLDLAARPPRSSRRTRPRQLRAARAARSSRRPRGGPFAADRGAAVPASTGTPPTTGLFPGREQVCGRRTGTAPVDAEQGEQVGATSWWPAGSRARRSVRPPREPGAAAATRWLRYQPARRGAVGQGGKPGRPLETGIVVAPHDHDRPLARPDASSRR